MSPTHAARWSHEEHCSALETEVRRLAEAGAQADPGAEVPTCPGWTAAKLLKHVGITHRWVEHMARERLAVPVRPRDVPAAVPEHEKDYPEWIAAGGAAMVATLRATPLDVPLWSWSDGRDVGFWSRRMLHETAVHRADAEFALGREPRVDPAVAADGIDELFGNLAAAGRFATAIGELGAHGTLHFHATDLPGEAGEWTLTLTPEHFTWTHAHGKGDAAARGTASDLLLLVYGRVPPSDARYEVFGDQALLGRWLEKTAF
ncbi:maleylpyruvate isomerase family mycothiol-dependent enzyme [Sphaerisporangium aureirubrum]|uniref:Maleylpyruvate isomerase family mycothiol-dependent enzyme n=1 Tax=Sphaerisporangium aureirubrum TaxID=1544736 RepID=A0ABW1NNT7_9ACTN